MSLFTFGKTKKDIEKKPVAPNRAVKVARTEKINGLSAGILLRPAITEKALILESSNHYVFEVISSASKPSIKKAVENAFGVDVVKVNILNNKRKDKFSKGKWGHEAGYRKAIIKIAAGQKIDAVPK